MKNNTTACVYLARYPDSDLKKTYDFAKDCYEKNGSNAFSLYVLLKRFSKNQQHDLENSLKKLAKIKVVKVTEEGYDLGSYINFSQYLNEQYLVFCNSHTVIQCPDFIQKLTTPLWNKEIGICGATGSWSSWSSFLPFKFVKHYGLLRWLLFNANKLIQNKRQGFNKFPNAHIRTTGFAIRSEYFKRLTKHWKIPTNKLECHLLESGKNGLSQLANKNNLKLYVVNSDGEIFCKNKWNKSNTFRVPNQRKLILADNQTKYYEDSDIFVKRRLELKTWGVSLS